MADTLPIDAVLPELLAAMAGRGAAVLQAPPGAGKTTRVPLALMPAVRGRIVMLEPRRLAARAAAERLAEQLGEAPGGAVGYRMRGESVPGRRIEVVTEGVLTRMLQTDPELPGVDCVIFDEFHERSLNADLGLALALEVRGALREDLWLLAMSATLDAGPVAALMGDVPVVTSEGRSHPVDLRYLDRPLGPGARIEGAAADLVARAVAETEGGVLVFLPGEGEIRRVAAQLEGRLPGECRVRPLFGALPFAEQRAAIRPDEGGRKVVLATSIAETSLTIEDVRVVVDAGRARRARFDPGSGMARLVTERVTRAEAAQRAGRAGRVAPGVCYRLWTKGEEGALAAYPPAEIEAADLAPLALELAVWGSENLPFLTPPPEGAMTAARALLGDLGALDAAGRITEHGRRLAARPVHPRLGHMLERGGRGAASLAAVLSERDPLRGAEADVGLRLAALQGRGPAVPRAVLERLRAEAKRLGKGLPEGPGLTVGQMAALAYPDRIGMRRPGDEPRYVLSGGKGARLSAADGLAGARFLVALDLDGEAREATVRLAARIEEGELRETFAERIAWERVCLWSRRERRVLARRRERLGALVLTDLADREADPEAVAAAMCAGVRELGLGLSAAAERFRARVELARGGGMDLPEMSDAALLAGLEEWLAPHLGAVRTAEEWRGFDALPALRAMLSWEEMQALDREVPARFVTPLGREVAIDYSGEHPSIELRLQEMFGLARHPVVGGRPLRIALLSPGGKPVAVTMDLPGFWDGAYSEVRKEMRGRYPKHPWPEDPREAQPTLRAKPRG
ncbi:ATP-dependent helicase HrpB [Histidinibacterium lentulum]|uniref:ATP-dependent helicase HrpB n=1 Tax=Histidinibacterium lentulum TaxID=2480588 RepID=A0A3N2QR78_9RHOB|nr:ATP-dependent helicase HrpB [Histidinibacterium lentulum]ROT97704.1 ATP-dependent helicase HrpB [Histidinibacterium lentulum]